MWRVLYSFHCGTSFGFGWEHCDLHPDSIRLTDQRRKGWFAQRHLVGGGNIGPPEKNTLAKQWQK